MGTINFRSGYQFDPETYATGGGLLAMLKRAIQEQDLQQQGGDFGSAQSPGGRAASLPRDPDFRYFARLSSNDPPVASDSSGLPTSPSRSTQQLEADQAQQAREVAAARLARGVRSAARAAAEPPDSVDIARSAGIGVAHGVINTLGLPGEILTGFGYLPNNLAANAVGRTIGVGQFAPDRPDWIRPYAVPDAIQQGIEGNVTGEFYQPKTRTGRFAETIGEFVPALLGGAGLAAARGGPAAAAALRELPATIAKHAVAPGVVVQGLEEADPDGWAGKALQKGYAVARRVLPTVLAAKKYFGR
ncbi:hypothetical protein JQ604_30755 [Bradyrhizobium jicamae]|uniref:hypothetical protein n=1 Tax=Bradyrhizobium jicamae TaxID=280332 RepID=UPI001BAAA472|nr:hypothetical protein [Bradyrhizobium jicamae]MBR0756581.1 hypothetical protein [Bradyrhizobium jicamae]